MSDTLKYDPRRARSAGDRYLTLLTIVLLGYALMGKGFAYIGLPPLYVGEIAFLIGIAVFLRSGVLVASIATLPAVVLVATMIWVLVRTVPFLNVYGFDALRDSVIILYGGFAFVVIGLLLEDARRIDTVIRYYRTALVVFPAMAVGFWLTKYWGEYVPKLYGPNVPVVEITASSVGTHLAGTAVFVLVGYRKVSFLWVVVWIVTLAMLGATTRGAMLAALVPIMFAMIMLGRLRSMLITLAAGLGILGLLYASEDTFYEEAKDSIEQWRLDWWDVIINDTFHGPSFWTGRGFGLNIADEDGFAGTVNTRNPRPLTRSPHNAFMTLLARAGVPGVVLWSLVLISWSGMMLRAMLVARARGHKQWTGLFLFITCYAMSIIINAAFDVTLEGPMQGIWFWCLFGFGIGSVMVYRAQPADGIASSGQ
jgi:hypothetical protein